MRDPRDESTPYRLQTVMPAGNGGNFGKLAEPAGTGGLLGKLAELAPEPAATYAAAPVLPLTPENMYRLWLTLSPALSPAVEPRNDPRLSSYAQTPWGSMAPPNPFALPPMTFPSTLPPGMPLSSDGGTGDAAPQPSPVTMAGLAKQAPVGLAKGLISLPGMIGDARDVGFNVADWVSQKILDRRTLTDQQRLEQAHGADFTPGAEARQKLQRLEAARKNLFATNPLLALAPSSADLQGTVEQVTGSFRKPENMAEEYVDTAGQFLPGAFGGGGGLARRGLQWLGPALASETAGQLTKGSEWEAAARLVAAILGGAPAFAYPSAPRGAAAPPPPRPAVAGEVPVAVPQRVEDARERAFGVPERVTAYAPHEAVAGKGTKHLPGMIDQPYDVREAYTNDARYSWANPVTGGDALYEALGSRVLPSRPATGAFTPGNGPLEINPAHVARPTAEMTPGGAIGNESRKMLELAETLRAYVDFQNMGAAHTLTRNVPWEQRNSVNIPINRRIDPTDMRKLTDFADPYGFYVSHRGHSPRGG